MPAVSVWAVPPAWFSASAGNTIGGTSPGAANVFGFATNAGVLIDGTNELVVGNLFGTNASGANVGNSVGLLDDVGSNTIGGTSSGAANVFGFNATAGLEIGVQAKSDSVLGDFFGTDSSGADLANLIGVLVANSGNTVGGATPGGCKYLWLQYLFGARHHR